MMKAKVFENPNVLEKQLNEWLDENPDVKIVNAVQSQAECAEGRSFVLTIFYTKSGSAPVQK